MNEENKEALAAVRMIKEHCQTWIVMIVPLN